MCHAVFGMFAPLNFFFLLLFISSIFLEVLNTQRRTSGEDYILHFCCERTIDFLLNNVPLISSPLIGNATRMWKTAGQTMLKLGLTFWTHFFHHNPVYFDKFYLIMDTVLLLNKKSICWLYTICIFNSTFIW